MKKCNLLRLSFHILALVCMVNASGQAIAVEKIDIAKPSFMQRWVKFPFGRFMKETNELAKKVTDGTASPEEIKKYRKRVAVGLSVISLLLLGSFGVYVAQMRKKNKLIEKIRSQDRERKRLEEQVSIQAAERAVYKEIAVDMDVERRSVEEEARRKELESRRVFSEQDSL